MAFLFPIKQIGLVKFSSEYSAKIAKGTSTTNTLQQLAWNVDEIGRLIDSGRKAHVEIQLTLWRMVVKTWQTPELIISYHK